MANYPASLDNGTSLPNPTSVSTQANPDHASLHSSENAAIIAAETKLGTGASTPASGTLLIGTGAGTSAWSTLTSAQLAAVLSDETGTGSAVFATTPTLVTPKVDTINENTPGNGVTVGGVNLKSGVITTASAVGTTAIATGIQLPDKMKNPYKFSVNRATAYTTVNSVITVFPFDTKTYDTSSNVDITTNKGRFTAPIAGFYHFDSNVQVTSAVARFFLSIYKNGAVYVRGPDNAPGTGGVYVCGVSDTVQMAAGDYVEILYFTGVAQAIDATGICKFSGFLVSAT